MREEFVRTELLLGTEAMEKLAGCRVAVFGIGGVGGHVCEALVRSGVGAFDLIDNDTVSVSNLNRQIIALRSTIGRYKVDVMKERMLDINPDADVRVHKCFFLPETAEAFSFEQYDYVVDAIDTVTGKIEIIMRAKACKVPIISAMGAGNKLDPGKFVITDIYKTRTCPLAKVMRRELKKRQVKDLKVLYSEEEAIRPCGERADGSLICPQEAGELRRQVPGSTAFVPAVAGLMIAGEVIRDLTGGLRRNRLPENFTKNVDSEY